MGISVRVLAGLMASFLLAVQAGAFGAVEEITKKYKVSEERQLSFSEEEASYEGEWVFFEDGFEIYVPLSWEKGPLSREDGLEGRIYGADGKEGILLVVYGESPEMKTWEGLYREYESSGASDVEKVLVNGIKGVLWSSQEVRGLSLLHPEDQTYFLSILVSAGEEGDLREEILSSVSPLS